MLATILGVATIVTGTLLGQMANASAPRKREYIMFKPGVSYPELGKQLADKWGAVFNVPSDLIQTIMSTETDFKPLEYNPRGHAFGMMQLKFSTAQDIARRGKQFDVWKDPRVKATLKSFRTENDLFNPDVNAMLGTFYLALLLRKFGPVFPVVSAAYNQGEGAVKHALSRSVKTGLPFQRFLKPEGQKYIAMAAEKQRGIV